jgi:pimeloyl-ACP methyl ester carboxylesterase
MRGPTLNSPPETRITHSADGTPIAWSVEGDGPALVVVNCVMAWRSSTPQPQLPAALARHFTVITYDRRGKGESGTTDPYAVERECEDLAAVIGAVGVDASVYGFSSGALLALTAAARGVPMTKVVALEPPIGGPDLPDRRPEFTRTLASDPRAANEFFMVDVQGIPADVLRTFPPLTSEQVAAVPTILHELTMLAEVDPQSLAASASPTLVLHSDHTAPFLVDCAERIHRAVPSSELTVLPGHWHGVADQLIVDECVRFLTT